jgi:hypothetical protein
MKLNNAEKSFLMLLIPIGLSFVCLTASQILMPENCYLYDNRNFGQMCHTIPETYPCAICRDVMTTNFARVQPPFVIPIEWRVIDCFPSLI